MHYIATQPEDADNSFVKTEIQMGSLAPYMLIPVGGNPYASDLVKDYWGAVRQLVSARVSAADASPTRMICLGLDKLN